MAGFKVLLVALAALLGYAAAFSVPNVKDMPSVTLNDGSTVRLGESDAALKAGAKYHRSVIKRLDNLAARAGRAKPIIVTENDKDRLSYLHGRVGKSTMGVEHVKDRYTSVTKSKLISSVDDSRAWSREAQKAKLDAFMSAHSEMKK